MDWLALDIGGAHLKAADGVGGASTRYFPLWQRPAELADALRDLLAQWPKAEALAVTMTGELADCFTTKAEGVAAILRAVRSAGGARAVKVYLTDGTWAEPDAAIRYPLLAAASNWHALARFAGRFAADGIGVLIDIGSTTADLIPLVDGWPAAQGHTDPERLVCGELVYTGVQRSPLCAVVDRVPWQGRLCPTAQELFATMWDAYLMTGDLPEEPHSTHTADGRPATRRAAHDRLARSICADRDLVDEPAAMAIAHTAAEAQVRQLVEALGRVIRRLPEPPDTVVLSGSGEFLGRRVVTRAGIAANIVSLGEELGPDRSLAATAHALAVLARETYG